MTRYASMFERAGARGVLGAFAMLGDPDPDSSLDTLSALVSAGADMIEVGIPFSDPVADGPTIQAAAERALARGMTPQSCIELLARFRERHPDVPLGVLTYANIVVARGADAFYRSCADAGVDSILLPDVPVMEAKPFVAHARDYGLCQILIAATNTPRSALESIAELGGGYTYCLARRGVTGTEREVELQHDELFRTLAELGAPPPILGFGISTPDHVHGAIAAGAAGAIVGSAIVKLIDREAGRPDLLARFVGDLRLACTASPKPFVSSRIGVVS